LSHIYSSTFKGNTSVGGIGGGVCAVGPFGGWTKNEVEHVGLSVTSCLFVGNKANTGGGAHLLAAADQPTNKSEWINNTFTGNEATATPSHAGNSAGKGGGLFLGILNYANGMEVVTVANSILQYNTGRSLIGEEVPSNLEAWTKGYLSYPYAPGAIAHNIIGDHKELFPESPDWDVTTTPVLTVADVDPKFRNPNAGDFQLSSISPCIERGNDTYLTVDYMDLDYNGTLLTQIVPVDRSGVGPYHHHDRESNVNGLGMLGFVGVDGGGAGAAICDIGCYEFQKDPMGSF